MGETQSNVKRRVLKNGRNSRKVLYNTLFYIKAYYIPHPRFLAIMTKTEIPKTATIPPKARLIDKIRYVSSVEFWLLSSTEKQRECRKKTRGGHLYTRP